MRPEKLGNERVLIPKRGATGKKSVFIKSKFKRQKQKVLLSMEQTFFLFNFDFCFLMLPFDF